MRVLVLALAILLLPLRGWVGDAMTIEAVTLPAAAQSTHSMAGTTHDGHGGHDAHQGHGAPAETSQPSHDCHSTCGDCQLCHSVAVTLWPALATLVEAPRAAPAFATAAFASAEPAPGLKPPIS